MCVDVRSASAQNLGGGHTSKGKAWMMLLVVLLMCSALPFCCNV
jgi:hypothetical protein